MIFHIFDALVNLAEIFNWTSCAKICIVVHNNYFICNNVAGAAKFWCSLSSSKVSFLTRVRLATRQFHSSDRSGQCSMPSQTCSLAMQPPVRHLNCSNEQSQSFSSSPLAHSDTPLHRHVCGMHHFSVWQRYSSLPQLSEHEYSSR